MPVVPLLWLAAVAPPALACVGPDLVVEVSPYRRTPRQGLVVAAGGGLPRAAELLSEASPYRGPVATLGPNVPGDPFGGSAGTWPPWLPWSCGKDWYPPVLVEYFVTGGAPLGRGLGESVHLVAGGPVVGGTSG